MRWLLNKLVEWHGVPTSHELLDRLSPAQKQQFEGEARMIKSSVYHKWETEDLELMVERWMFRGNKDDQLFGAGMLYMLNIREKNLQQLSEGKVMVDSPEKKKMRRFI